MKKTILVKPLALKNIQKAYSWYEIQLNGLGEQFIDEWESTANHILSYQTHTLKSINHSGKQF